MSQPGQPGQPSRPQQEEIVRRPDATRRETGRKRFPKRPCPVCGGAKSKLLFRESFEPFEGSLLDGYDVVICENCGAGFADDIPPQATFDEYYRDLSKYENEAGDGSQPAPVEGSQPLPVRGSQAVPVQRSHAAPVQQRFRDLAGLIASHIPARDSRVLEIGCASGGLLKALRDLGFRNLLGVDPSPGCIRAARDCYGIPGFAATVFSVPQPKEPYDFLILIGVMEHIRDLDRAIERFALLLRPGGRVFLEVPDASRYDWRLDAPFQEFSTEHINFFSAASLANLMRARGFGLLEAGHSVRPLHEVTCPCAHGVFEHSVSPAPIQRDLDTESGLLSYIAGCNAEDARIRAAIRQCLLPGERVIVWGVGTHTLRLLATGGLDSARIALFVDSNPKYQQRQLRGVPVVSPSELKARTEPILISSKSSQQDIQNQIRNNLGLKNPLILLYGRVALRAQRHESPGKL